MREIKFRAWNPVIKILFDIAILHNNYIFGYDYEWGKDDWMAKAHDREQCVLEQFTGLLDKNRKEIYEGDIITISDGPTSDVIWIPQFACFGIQVCKKIDVYLPGLYSFDNIHDVDDEAKAEIIGNIHENPELLAVKQ